MKIILIGYMASGKSTIGKLLADKVCLPFIDLDSFISQKENLSVASIFKEKGEIYFRQKESLYLSELLDSDNSFVLSLGGGTPCYSNNMKKILGSNAESIYLRGNISTISERIKKNKKKRPLVASIADKDLPEFIAKHLFERAQYYEQSKTVISIDKKTKKEIVNEIWVHLQQVGS